MVEIRVGTSGWQYRDWRAVFYPEGMGTSRWFRYYARHFSTVEINASFYRLPTPAAITRWREQAPEGFRYAAKGSRYITHNLKIGGEKLPGSVELGMGRLAGLGSSLAVVLWQLPPQLHRDVGRLDAFLGLLPGGVRHAVEFRHRSWVHEDVFSCLDAHRAAHVWVSSAAMPADTTVTGDLVYLRFHGLGAETYRYRYSPEELRPWAAAVTATGCEAYVFFNNDYEGNAIADARTFAALLGDAGPGAVTPQGGERDAPSLRGS